MPDSRRVPPGDRVAPRAVVGRVSLYLRQLESAHRQGQTTITSRRLGSGLGINDAQVRKDLAHLGQFGQPGIGYRVEDLTRALRRTLGIDRDWPTALIGLGDLGRALVKYRGFRGRNFRIASLFDNDARKIGQSHDGLIVQPLESLPQSARAQSLSLAILCVPAEAAQRVADLVISTGITGILNFAPLPLVVPPDVSVVAVDLSVQLEYLAYKVQNAQGGVSYAG